MTTRVALKDTKRMAAEGQKALPVDWGGSVCLSGCFHDSK